MTFKNALKKFFTDSDVTSEDFDGAFPSIKEKIEENMLTEFRWNSLMENYNSDENVTHGMFQLITQKAISPFLKWTKEKYGDLLRDIYANNLKGKNPK